MMSSNNRTEIFTDYLGFTNQTATVLRGLGGTALIDECKKRNISTKELHKLTKNDFIQLGANDNLAENLVDQLKISSKDINIVQPDTENRLRNFMKILETSKQQLDFIHAYVAYCRLRLKKETINFFIDPNKALTASSVLHIAVRETLYEVDNMEKAIQELSAFIPKANKGKSSKYYISLCTLFAGLSMVIGVILHVRKD